MLNLYSLGMLVPTCSVVGCWTTIFCTLWKEASLGAKTARIPAAVWLASVASARTPPAWNTELTGFPARQTIAQIITYWYIEYSEQVSRCSWICNYDMRVLFILVSCNCSRLEFGILVNSFRHATRRKPCIQFVEFQVACHPRMKFQFHANVSQC